MLIQKKKNFNKHKIAKIQKKHFFQMFQMSDSILLLFRMIKFTKNKTSKSHSRVTRSQKGEKENELVVVPPKKCKKSKSPTKKLQK